MEDTAEAYHRQSHAALRQLRPGVQHGPGGGAHHNGTATAQDLVGLDLESSLRQGLQNELQDSPHHQLQGATDEHGNPIQQNGGPYGPITPQHNSIARLTGEEDVFSPSEPSSASKRNRHIHFGDLIPNPPDLDQWRQRLFDVDEPIVLTDEQFNTYFPHVDNVYSHRSTQTYKRKPFVSHYYDCRLKGRPPGTPKSTDPNKKKRDRKARARDLCDVKIKVTEHLPTNGMAPFNLPQNTLDPGQANFFAPGAPGSIIHGGGALNFGAPSYPMDHPATSGQRYWTIQRVNGNGGNGKSDGVGGPHRHTLEESDRIKKSSVQRAIVAQEGGRSSKKAKPPQKSYHKRATGAALETVRRRSKESDLKLFGSCFCPFVQRVWISLELKGIDYQYIEVDPYKKPPELLEVNPRGLVPALRHGNWACYESTVLLDYLEDINFGYSLMPGIQNPQLRAHCRLWCDHVNRHIVPGFYRYLQAQELDKQLEYANELKTLISSLVDASDPDGPFFLGQDICIVDVMFAPWIIRLSRVLAPYRSWPAPEVGSRWERWVDAIENNEAVRATTSTNELYLDSYERYAENRPDTSMVARAINSGRGLP